MMNPREWRFGRHVARWEGPDVLWMRIDGSNGLEETLPMVKLLKTLGEQSPLFVLADFKAAGALEPEARRYMSENVRSEWFQGLVLYNTRLLHRAMARGLIFAGELFHAAPEVSVMRKRVHFTSSEELARSLIARLRDPAEVLSARD